MPQGVGVRLPPPAPNLREIFMKVKEKKSKGLKREFSIQIEFKEISSLRATKLKEIASKSKISGFRPGKVPISHVDKMYGKDVTVEAIEEKVSETSRAVLEERGLRAAVSPQINMNKEMEKIISSEEDVEYTMSCEVLPDIEIIDFKKIKLENPVAEPQKKDIDDALTYMSEQNPDYTKPKKKRVAKDLDKLNINYVGLIDGEKFEGGTADKADIILGSKTFIGNFEEQLLGASEGDKKNIKVKFPENYQNKDLENKDAIFEVEVNGIYEPKNAKIDDNLAKRLGQESLDALKDTLSDQIKKDFNQASRIRLKDSLFDYLEKNHNFDLPSSLVDQEYDQMWHQLEHQLEEQKKSLNDLELKESQIKKNYKEIAEKRISIGLLIAEIGRLNKIELDNNDINIALQNEMQRYPGQENEIIKYYQNNAEAMRGLTAPVYEDKVVDYVLSKVDLNDKKITREDLFETKKDISQKTNTKKNTKKSDKNKEKK